MKFHIRHSSFVILLLLLSAFSFQLTAFSADHPFGWKSNPNHAKQLRQFIHAPGYRVSSIKPVSDLSAGLPAVYDQGQIGSCTANAGSAAFEYAWKQQHGAFLNVSRMGLYSDELKHDGNWPQDAGSFTASILWVLQNKGIGLESCVPYVVQRFGMEPPKCYAASSSAHKMVKCYDVDNTDHVSIRVALSNGFPVVFGGYVYGGIQSLPSTNILTMPRKGERPIGGHEMLIVGHNDAKKLYKVRNSWGTAYGAQGYFFIPYAYIENGKICEDFAVVQVTN